MDEQELRQKAREAIQAGRMPTSRPEGVWGGRGAGVECAVCGQVVSPDTLGFDLDFGPSVTVGVGNTPHVHIRCFAAWEFEYQSRLPAESDGLTISSCVRHGTNGSGS
jgi:hypothetical protein